MVSLTEKQQRDLLIAVGLGDFLVGGKITAVTRKAVVGALKRILPAAGRAAVPAVASVARTGLGVGRLLMYNPYIAGGTAIYVGITERERIKQMLDQGYEFMSQEGIPAAAEFVQERSPYAPAPDYSGGRSFGVVLPTPIRKKRPSKFNSAVKAGMLAVKKSTSYGKKGTIKPAKKAFSVVVKLASAKSKKKKAPKSGIKRKIWNAMRGY